MASKPSHFAARQAIRSTWAQDFQSQAPNFKAQVVFLLGHDPQSESGVMAESVAYHDIILEDFTDHYYNLTIKSVLMLKFISRHQIEAKYVAKVR